MDTRTNSFLERMRWFYRNIELQVEDIKLEEAEKTIVHYFDAGDVQGALLGVQDLYQEGPNGAQFNKSEFDSKRTLIRSLLSSQRLGQIRLLPPHQDELISKLKRGFKHWTRAQWEDKVADFITKVGLSPELYPQHIEAQNSTSLASLLKEDLEQAQKLFKVFQNLLPWHRRLGIWQRKELIYYENTKIDPAILLSREFKLLEQKLSIQPERKDKYINNFTDALAWTYLFYLIKQFNSGSSHIVPRLYSPETKFSLQKILKLPVDNRELNREEKTIEENFGCKSDVGRFSVLRDDDYYLFKVAFRPDSFSTSSNKPNKGKTDKDEKLVALYTQLNKLIPSDEVSDKEELPLESFNKLSYEGTPILNIIKGLEQLTFFQSSWLKGGLYKELWEALSDIRQHLDEVEQMQEMQETLQQKKYQDAVKLIITDIQGKIEEKVQAFSSIPTFWKALSNGIKNLKLRLHRDEWDVNDYYRDLGLLRYGFPREIRSKVTQIIDGLCSGDEDRIQDQYLQFIQDYLNARFYARENEDSLMTSTAILLALRMYKDVFDLLKDHQFKHFALRIACAEMFLNLGKKDHHFDKEYSWKQGRRIIEELRQLEASPSISAKQKAELCVGLAYLFYHAWRFKDNDAQWRKVSLASGHQSNEWKRWQDLIDSAATYASRAYNLLEGTDRNQLKVYALNEYVFFLVEGGSPERMGEIKEAAELLAGYRAEPDLWQFRCDDTLARFHHRLAVYARTIAEWEEHTADALSLIEEARKRSDIDQQIESYYRLLKIYKTRGFSERRMSS